MDPSFDLLEPSLLLLTVCNGGEQSQELEPRIKPMPFSVGYARCLTYWAECSQKYIQYTHLIIWYTFPTMYVSLA